MDEELQKQEEPEGGGGGVSELERAVAEREAGKARITELESWLAQKEEEISGLKQAGQEMEKRVGALGNFLSEAVASYKAAVVRANPEVIEELITGDTIESVNESLKRAKELVGKVRQGVESEIAQARVPAGAPERRTADLSSLSPREKIQYAMGKR